MLYHRLLAALLLVVSQYVAAEESCGHRAVRMLSEGRSAELARLFKAPGIRTIKELEDLSKRAGKLTEMAEVAHPRFLDHTRYSVLSPRAERTYSFRSFRINAVAEQLGPVQVQVAMAPDAECQLLAIHLDVDPRQKRV